MDDGEYYLGKILFIIYICAASNLALRYPISPFNLLFLFLLRPSSLPSPLLLCQILSLSKMQDRKQNTKKS